MRHTFLALLIALTGCNEPPVAQEAPHMTPPSTATQVSPSRQASTPPHEDTLEEDEAVPQRTQQTPSVDAAKGSSATDLANQQRQTPSFKEAMDALTKCERDPSGLLVANTAACLKPVRDARRALLLGDGANAPLDAKRQELATILESLLTHIEPTVVFYTLQEGRADFRASVKTIEELERLMASPIGPIAEAAATARFSLKGAAAKGTKALALARFNADPQRRVRHAACQHLGEPRYKGQRDVLNALLDAAKREGEEGLIRTCAAREAGDVATSRDLKKLSALLDFPEVQQATIVALQRGMGTPKAISTYVRWFERHATQPEKVHWTSMHAFLPWDTELDRMPRKASVNALSQIAGHSAHSEKVRTLAIQGLKRLKADAALEALRQSLPKDAAATLKKALAP